MAKGDLYAVLGVRRDASPATIKRAYLRLAKKFHPDLNKTREAHERFLAVKEAYETLSSPLRRREYDERSSTAPPWEAPWRTPEPARVIRVTVPYGSAVAAKQEKAAKIRQVREDRRRRQLSLAYTAVTAGMSVMFLAGSFLFVALGGVLPGIVSFLMGLTLVLVLFHVIPFLRFR